MKKNVLFLSVCSLLAGWTLDAQDINRMVLQANKIGAEIQPTMYGHFFEDINFGADGGLYAELVKNRSFDFPQRLMGWDVFGSVTVQDDGPFERNPHYVRLAYAGHAQKHTGIENEGFFGIGLKQGAQYRFTVWARGAGQSIRVELFGFPGLENRLSGVEAIRGAAHFAANDSEGASAYLPDIPRSGGFGACLPLPGRYVERT